MHESTVSRVTANKYIATSRGVFELKYFFTASIASVRRGRGPLGRGGAPSHPPDDRRGGVRTTSCPTTPSSSASRRPASTSPAARWRNIARRCASAPRSSAGARRRAGPDVGIGGGNRRQIALFRRSRTIPNRKLSDAQGRDHRNWLCRPCLGDLLRPGRPRGRPVGRAARRCRGGAGLYRRRPAGSRRLRPARGRIARRAARAHPCRPPLWQTPSTARSTCRRTRRKTSR